MTRTVRVTGLSLVWLISTVSCADPRAEGKAQSSDTSGVWAALEQKVCITIGARTYSAADRCKPQVDRRTFIQPVFDVYRTAPPILKAYLCSLDRIYFDYEVNWNADWSVTVDRRTQREYRSINVRRGLLERNVGYVDWASGWTQHWWTGAPIDRPSADPTLPRVESDLRRPSDVLFQLLAHESAHVLDYDYRITMRRQPSNKPFERGEFGFLSWVSPRYEDSTGWHSAVARAPALSLLTPVVEANRAARLATRTGTEKQGKTWDAGISEIANWRPASRERVSAFLERLDTSNFTTVFSTWRPDDDWTDSFAMMMLSTVAKQIDIVGPGGRRLRLLQKVSDPTSAFAPKRAFIQQVIDRALSDFRARHSGTQNACFADAIGR